MIDRPRRPGGPPRRRLFALLLAVAPVLGACSGGDDSATDAPGTEESVSAVDDEAVLATIADDVIVPAYEALVADLADLTTTVDALCGEPAATGLEDAREGWRTALTSWQRTRAGAVGPAMERRLMSAVGFDARPEAIDELLAGADPVDPRRGRR
ncbi:imelysin family protein [Iamia sp.]|uniref:imelysin family protein n=1 Tax=Iamia sp. TaxID=2722710 RepID=UPI002CDFA9C3|nr:imelysin family protein [Iamia sp.]HXH57591.1 imelysin family protein [Iamia sp.]